MFGSVCSDRLRVCCRECRGPVQVRRQKLQEFLNEVDQAGGDAQPGLHELARATQGGEGGGARDGGGDDDDWANVKEGLVIPQATRRCF